MGRIKLLLWPTSPQVLIRATYFVLVLLPLVVFAQPVDRAGIPAQLLLIPGIVLAVLFHRYRRRKALDAESEHEE